MSDPLGMELQAAGPDAENFSLNLSPRPLTLPHKGPSITTVRTKVKSNGNHLCKHSSS